MIPPNILSSNDPTEPQTLPSQVARLQELPLLSVEWTSFPVRGTLSSQANKGCVCAQTSTSEQALANRKGKLHPHLFPTFSDFAFLALCTNLRPSFLAYQIEANIAMPVEGIHNEAAAQTTSHHGSETNRIRLELSLPGCCFLGSSHAG